MNPAAHGRYRTDGIAAQRVRPPVLAGALWLALLLAAAAPALAQPVSFTAPTNFAAGAGPFSVAVGAFNGDSHPDLAVANVVSSSVSILVGDGSGGFTGAGEFAVGLFPVSVAVGDFQGDFHPDLAVSNSGSGNVSILLGDGSGSFTGPTNFAAGFDPRSVAVGDFNGDFHPDLAATNLAPGGVSILLGDGSGSFTAPTYFALTATFSVAVGDLNADYHPALSVTVTGVNQDEPLNGLGDGDTSPDARAGSQSNDVLLRAERSGGGNGRVYRIAFRASDGKGGTCEGAATVAVPHDQGKPAVNSAPPSCEPF